RGDARRHGPDVRAAEHPDGRIAARLRRDAVRGCLRPHSRSEPRAWDCDGGFGFSGGGNHVRVQAPVPTLMAEGSEKKGARLLEAVTYLFSAVFAGRRAMYSRRP